MKSQDRMGFRSGLIQDMAVCVEQEMNHGEGQIGDAAVSL